MGAQPAYAIGFESVDTEYTDVSLEVEGRVPDWLQGSLYRNGPGQFETNQGPLAHWFDGLAMLRRFCVDGPENSITYTNRFLRSDTYRRATSDEGLQTGQFGTAGGSGLLDSLRSRLLPEPTDNANVNVRQFGDTLVAITETSKMLAFDRETLGTRGAFDFDDTIQGQWQCAHPIHDPIAETTVNLLVNFGRETSYEIVQCHEGATTRERVASIPVSEPAYTHSFALTDQYVVLTEPPLVIDPFDLILPWRGGEAFVDSFRWEPERGTRIRLIDRDSGAVAATCRGPAMFVFHHVNAFERDGQVIVDLVGFPDDRAIADLYLETLRAGNASPSGRLLRLSLPTDGGAVSREVIATGLTLPRANERYRTSDHQYTWAQQAGPGAEYADRIAKAAPPDGLLETWRQPGWFAGEPVMVPAPNGAEPDDGVVLVVALDPDRERSVFVVLDAATLEEHARAPLPHVAPFDFHGQFIGAPADRHGIPPR